MKRVIKFLLLAILTLTLFACFGDESGLEFYKRHESRIEKIRTNVKKLDSLIHAVSKESVPSQCLNLKTPITHHHAKKTYNTAILDSQKLSQIDSSNKQTTFFSMGSSYLFTFLSLTQSNEIKRAEKNNSRISDDLLKELNLALQTKYIIVVNSQKVDLKNNQAVPNPIKIEFFIFDLDSLELLCYESKSFKYENLDSAGKSISWEILTKKSIAQLSKMASTSIVTKAYLQDEKRRVFNKFAFSWLPKHFANSIDDKFFTDL